MVFPDIGGTVLREQQSQKCLYRDSGSGRYRNGEEKGLFGCCIVANAIDRALRTHVCSQCPYPFY
jgi:hypothetical protein